MLKHCSHIFFVLLVLATVLASCSIERRHYRNGLYVSRVHHETCTSVAATVVAIKSDTLPSSVVAEQTVAPQTTGSDSAETSTEDVVQNSLTVANEEIRLEQTELSQSAAPHTAPDEPVAKERDHLNRMVLLLTLLGFFLVACLMLIGIAYLPFCAVAMFFCMPILGALSFAAAMLYRRKIKRGIAQGKTGNKYRLSAYFSKFEGLLYTFFASVVIGLLGFGLIYGPDFGTSLFVLYILGLLMLSAAAAVINALSLILVAFGLLYLFRWRKYPDGNPPSLFKRRKSKAERAKAES